MRQASYWVGKFLTRERFARPLLNAAMFAWLLTTIELVTIIFPGYINVFIRWALVGTVFVFSFWLYVHFEQAKEKAKEKTEEAKGKVDKDG